MSKPSKNNHYFNNMLSLQIGDILRTIRKNLNLTLAQVSQNTGIAIETIRRLEVNQFEPKLSTLEILSDFYRIDIIELISRKRNIHSIFSEELISKVNHFINKSDFENLKAFSMDTLSHLEANAPNHFSTLRNFLYSIQYLKIDPSNKQNDISSILDSILLDFSPDSYKPNTTTYPVPIELSVIIYYSFILRQNKEFTKAINLLTNTIDRVKSMPLINDRNSDYLAALFINLAYTYHSMNCPKMVVECVDKCLGDHKVSYTKIALSHLLFRKGLALHQLNEPEGLALVKVSISLMDEKNKSSILQNLKTDYQIELS